VKAYSLPAALGDVAPAVGPETMILPVLNGMKHVDAITERFGANALVGCVCRIAAESDDKGRIVQLANFQELAYGEMDARPSSRTERLDEFMKGAGFTARLSPEIAREMWEKWLLLASLGGTTCLMRGNIGQIEAAPGGREFAMGLLDEVTTIIRTTGEQPSAACVEEARTLLTTKGSALTSSMYRDLQKHQRIEADQIIGDLLARGQKAGIAAPLLSAAFANLTVYQNQLDS
jgi:2-dehydropantoate 2-reductase